MHARIARSLLPMARRRIGGRAVGRLLIGGLGIAALLPGAAAAADEANAPSPAGPTAAVIAHGVAPMPAAEVAWRVVDDTAEPLGEAPVEEHALGFALAREDAVLLADETTGARTRLAAGEAAFVTDGAQQRRESLGAEDTALYHLALVPATEAEDAGGDVLVFAGKPFAAPAGEHDLDLVRGHLLAEQTDGLPDTGTQRSCWRRPGGSRWRRPGAVPAWNSPRARRRRSGGRLRSARRPTPRAMRGTSRR